MRFAGNIQEAALLAEVKRLRAENQSLADDIAALYVRNTHLEQQIESERCRSMAIASMAPSYDDTGEAWP